MYKMRFFKWGKITLLFFLSVLIISCKQLGPLTPREAFYSLKDSLENLDSGAVVKLLSQGSIKKIKTIAEIFSRMNDKQILSLSEIYNVPVEKMKNLSTKDFISLYFSQKRHNNIISQATMYNIISIDRKGDRADIRVENGMVLPFVKEGPYWKFDMTRL